MMRHDRSTAPAEVGVAVALCLLAVGACGDGDPVGLDGSALPERVFVACRDSTLTVYDVEQGGVLDVIPLPDGPISVAAGPNGDRVYVGLRESGGIVEVDARSLQVLRTMPTPPMGLGLDVSPDGQMIWGTNGSEGLVTVVSLSTGELLDTVRIGMNPQYLRLDPTGSEAFVPLFESDQLAVLSTSDRSIEALIPLGEIDGGPAGVAVSPDGGTVYVGAFGRDGYLQLVSPSSATVFRRVAVGESDCGCGRDLRHGCGYGPGWRIWDSRAPAW